MLKGFLEIVVWCELLFCLKNNDNYKGKRRKDMNIFKKINVKLRWKVIYYMGFVWIFSVFENVWFCCIVFGILFVFNKIIKGVDV